MALASSRTLTLGCWRNGGGGGDGDGDGDGDYDGDNGNCDNDDDGGDFLLAHRRKSSQILQLARGRSHFAETAETMAACLLGWRPKPH